MYPWKNRWTACSSRAPPGAQPPQPRGKSEQTVDFRGRPLLHLRGWGACGCHGSSATAGVIAGKDPREEPGREARSCALRARHHTHPGAGEWAAARGEGPEALRPTHQQQGVFADLHPHPGATAQLLHAGPWQRGLAHHDRPAGPPGVRH